MTFILVAALLSVIVLGLILLPLLRDETDQSANENPDAAIYRSQLQELKRDVADGTIGADEAKTAEAEISRRLLAVSGTEGGADSKEAAMSKTTRLTVAALIALVIPLTATVVYMNEGVPFYESQPHMGDQSEADRWMAYGQVQAQQQKFGEAAASFAEAVRLSEPRAELYEMYGEALFLSGNGQMSQDAFGALQKAVELDPKRERARYILAEWLYMNGRPEDGVRIMIDLLEETQNPEFRLHLDTRIQDAIAQLREAAEKGEDISGGSAVTRPEPVKPAQQQSNGLTGMSQEQRTQIEGMVAGLAARLEEAPNDIEGWLRLIRSYSVMGDEEQARAAVDKATFVFLTDPLALQRILSLVEELKIVAGPKLPEDAKTLQDQD